jgi:hypothetical protein
MLFLHRIFSFFSSTQKSLNARTAIIAGAPFIPVGSTEWYPSSSFALTHFLKQKHVNSQRWMGVRWMMERGTRRRQRRDKGKGIFGELGSIRRQIQFPIFLFFLMNSILYWKRTNWDEEYIRCKLLLFSLAFKFYLLRNQVTVIINHSYNWFQFIVCFDNSIICKSVWRDDDNWWQWWTFLFF